MFSTLRGTRLALLHVTLACVEQVATKIYTHTVWAFKVFREGLD